MLKQDPVSATASQSSKVRAPGFDGVRALAILAVMTFHEQFAAMPGGFLGVDVFFVLSGYLITDLLVTHRDRYGRLDLRRFWLRRARRLLPALAVMLAGVTAAAALIEPGQLGQLRPTLIAAVTYASNWWQAGQHQSYFSAFGSPPPLQHLWSLAIEEQFYLAWPLILALVLGLRRRTARAAVAWLGAALSAIAMAVLYTPGSDPSRVYYGTDTHAAALLAGCAIALTWPLAELVTVSGERARRHDVAGVTGLAVLAWAAGHFSGRDSALFPAGLLVVALAAAALVVAAASPGAVSGMLGWRPLRWLGVRSYGIYLWHWPVIALTAAVTGPGRQSILTWIIESTAAIALAAASWRWIETPILRDGFRATFRTRYRALARSLAAARRSPSQAVPALALAGALTVACTAGYRVLSAPTASALQWQISTGAKVSAATHTGGPGHEPGRTRLQHPAAAAAASRSSGQRPGGLAGRRAIAGSDVTAIGDSVMLAAAPQLRRALPGIYIDAQVSRQMSAGLQLIRKLAATGLLRPVVIVGLGTNGPVTGQQIRELIADIGPDRDLVLVSTFVPQPWEAGVNRAYAAVAGGRHPTVVLADWRAAIANRTSLLWPDGVHPRPAGARLYATVLATAVRTMQDPPAAPGN